MKDVLRQAVAHSLAGLIAAALSCAIAAHAKKPALAESQPAEPAADRVAPVSADADVEALKQRHEAAFLVALKEQVCLLTRGCVTDEGRLLDALETCKLVEADLAARADSGNREAALVRGLIALRMAQSHSSRSLDKINAQLPGASVVLRRRWAQETQVGERYLSIAAQQGQPQACLALAEHLSARVPQTEAQLVSHLFLCAVTGFDAKGDRAGAIDAYSKMRAALRPSDPLLVNAHVLIYRLKSPGRPWQQVEPAEAMAVRKAASP